MTEPAPIVFLDTETTGLAHDDEVWEIAAVRRDPDGTEAELHLFIEHDGNLCVRLPEEFRADHAARFPSACSGRVTSRRDACNALRRFLNPTGSARPVMVGINPAFDLGHVSRLFRAEFPHWDPTPWHYTPVDARHLAVGHLHAQGEVSLPPWDSETVSRQLGINPNNYDRHTAMGDVQWAMAIYDAVTAGPNQAGDDQ